MQIILLIEDDVTMCDLLKTLFQLEGFKVEVPDAIGENEIMSAIHLYQPALVFLDVNLKAINGLAIAPKIQALNNSPKILMSSGMFLERECILAGADGFILKPYLPGELIEKINFLLAQNS